MATASPFLAPQLSIIPNFISQNNSLVNLLAASAADPSLFEGDDDTYSSESLEDSDTSPTTPIDSNSENAFPHIYHHDPLDHSPLHRNLIRGQSLLSESHLKEESRQAKLVEALALDQSDATDAAVERAQYGATGETFEEPLVIDSEKTMEERMENLVKEFGPWTDGTERFVQQIPGALYRGVLLKGLLAISTKRLFFFGYVPPIEDNKLIRSGPVTVHFPGFLTKKRRSWVELTSDSVLWYASSAKVYKPMGACRLSQVKVVQDYNEEEPNVVRIDLIDGRKRILELDTAESAMNWRADMEATVFSMFLRKPDSRSFSDIRNPSAAFRATADKLRLALPLQRISDISIAPYMSLGERVQITFDAGVCVGDDAASNEEQKQQPTVIDFGYIKSHHDFSEDLEAAIEAVKGSPICGGAQPILEIDSEVRAGDLELQKEVRDDKGLAARFVRTFALVDQPSALYVAADCELVRSLPTWGSLVVSSSFLCFWRRSLVGGDVKLRIPLVDIDEAGPCKAFGFRVFGLTLQVHGSPDVRFDFHSRKIRDETVEKIQEAIFAKQTANLTVSPYSTLDPRSSTLASVSSVPTGASPYIVNPVRGVFEAADDKTMVLGHDMTEDVYIEPGAKQSPIPRILGAVGRRKVTGVHFVCLTIGSRGDVQPYVALGRELIKDGNTVTIASHPEYREWVESYGIGYREVGGDPGALMKLSVEHKIFSPAWFKESLGHFRGWLDDLFAESWAACQDADILIESPSTMAGIHVAEALGIPYFRAFTMPWTASASYPHAFGASVDLGPTYNLLSYAIFDSIIWKATSGQVNRWRKTMLNLPPTSMHKMSQAKTPFIYNFSTAVVPRPNDWRDFICISGYWFLDDEKVWTPPPGLLEFIQRARDDGKAILYVGFGSIVVPDSAAVTQAVVNATKNADVRVILSKGWSDRGSKPVEEVAMPPEIFSVPSIAHDRLFPLIDAAVHHGGAGTTGASLRAGLPTIIHPFFGDQYFWASRVQKLGAGLQLDSLREKDLTTAFRVGTTDRVIKEKAAIVGEKIRNENGPRTAINFITDHIHLAQERADLRASRARKEKADPKLAHTRTFSSSLNRSSSSPSRKWLHTTFSGSNPNSSQGDETIVSPTAVAPKASTPCALFHRSSTPTIPSFKSHKSNESTDSGSDKEQEKEKEKRGLGKWLPHVGRSSTPSEVGI